MRPIKHPLAVFALAFAAYVALAWFSTAVAGTRNDISGLWAPNVIFMVLLLRNPSLRQPAIWAAILLGAFFGNLVKGAPVSACLLFACWASMLVWTLVRVNSHITSNGANVAIFASLLFRMLTVIVLGSVAFGFAASFLLGWDVAQSAAHLAFSNLVAGALFVPFGMVVTRDRLERLMQPEMALRLTAWMVTCSGTMLTVQVYSEYAFAFSIVPLMIAAMRLPPLAVAVVCMVTGLSGIVAAVDGFVHTLAGDIRVITTPYQFAVCVNVLLPFFAGLLMDQVSRARRRLADSEERYRRAVHDASVGIFTMDLEGHVLDCNPAFARMLDYAPHELIGRRIQDFSPQPDMQVDDDLRHSALSGKPERTSFEKRYVRRDGTEFWARVSASVVRDGSRPEGIVLVSQVDDIDARIRAERQLAEMKDRWDFALASAGQGFWDHNQVDNKLTYSTTWTTMLGYGPGEIDGNSSLWLELIHPDDRQLVEELDRKHQAGEIPYFEHEYRMRHQAGHWLWVLDRGKVIERNADGNVKRMIGTLTDISQRKAIEENLEVTAGLLRREKERLRVTLESIGDAVICTNADGEISFMNPEAEKLTGVSAEDGVGRRLPEVYAARTDQGPASGLARGKGRTPWHGSVLERRDGVQLSIREVVAPIVSERGDVEGKVIVFQDFTDLRSMQHELEHAALHDDLTGLMNRTGFLRALDELLVRARSDGSEHHVLYIDLDRFKHVNDTSGHAAGDAMLRIVGKAIRDCVRSSDIVARLGGDEFAVVLPGSPPAFARLIAMTVVERITSLELLWSGRVFRVGASVGGARLDGSVPTIDELIARADAACYAAKARGGSSVEFAPAPDVQDINRKAV